ncbi:nuclease [Sphingomonas sp. MM-1]|uniref:thermonuclease family protein n=1 Tax=Sphingomonas sp. MM-1 TaxID=745310 RepID=UPI0002C1427F|nr:thermonuclease family protein [Sphingomonas sp. MM-1]AGH48726.1 nuclease [Sphingomonas sp. MM-1]
MMLALAAAVALTGCVATDGDTVRCGDQRIRLLGIDAPEMPGHCRRGRICAPGDPITSKASLAAALTLGPIRFEQVTTDRYGRAVGIVWAGNVNTSCWQLRRGQAVYRKDWDHRGVIGRCVA